LSAGKIVVAYTWGIWSAVSNFTLTCTSRMNMTSPPLDWHQAFLVAVVRIALRDFLAATFPPVF
jgi:hypothetical protein